jgi:hypothetical protein
MEEARHERARDRELIRHKARAAINDAGAHSPHAEPAGSMYTDRLLEQLVLAVCNLAETLDAQGLES